MSEFIKREDALDAVLFALVGTGYQSNAIYAIKDVPSADVVEVVRCKDCIHAREVKHRGEVIEGIYRCSYIKMSTNLFDIDYCRYGKRRSENEG